MSLIRCIKGRWNCCGQRNGSYDSVLEVKFSKKQMKLLKAWMAIHEDELLANWRMLNAGDRYFKIEPLK